MKQLQLALYNLGKDLDDLMNLDPRGYGVCRILYDGASHYTGRALSVNGALMLLEAVKPGDTVFILTGFIIAPTFHAETDGAVSSVFLAKALAQGLSARPVIFCPEDAAQALPALLASIGVPAVDSLAAQTDGSVAVIAIAKEMEQAQAQAETIMSTVSPAALVAVECCGANAKGVYHTAAGLDVTAYQAKMEPLFDRCQAQAVPSLVIGDLGNELGMGVISEHIRHFIPRAAEGGCHAECSCGGGILARTAADHIITATVSDWGSYALIAALAYLQHDISIMPESAQVAQVITLAPPLGVVDSYDASAAAVDGVDAKMIGAIVDVMRGCVADTLKNEGSCQRWFDEVLQLGFYTAG